MSIKWVAPPQTTALIVDDNWTNPHFLGKILARIGCNTQMAVDEPSALAIANATSLDLILLDILMPGMNGYEVCKRLKIQPHTQHISVIFISALEEVSDTVKAFCLGTVDFIQQILRIFAARRGAELERKQAEAALSELFTQQSIELQKARAAAEAAPSPPALQETLHVQFIQSELGKIMPPEWLERCSQAAILGSEQQLLHLIDRILEGHASIAAALTALVNNFCFDSLLTLAQPRENGL